MFNKLASENTLVRAQFGRTLEGEVACLGGTPSFLGSYANQRALELRDASEDGEHHAPGRRCRRLRVAQKIEVRRFSPRSDDADAALVELAGLEGSGELGVGVDRCGDLRLELCRAEFPGEPACASLEHTLVHLAGGEAAHVQPIGVDGLVLQGVDPDFGGHGRRPAGGAAPECYRSLGEMTKPAETLTVPGLLSPAIAAAVGLVGVSEVYRIGILEQLARTP